jgi:hypothetical protein
MKKSKLIIEYDFDFDLIGIASAARGYKFAWELNRLFSIHLIKQLDLVIGYKNDIERNYAYFSHITPLTQIRLFRNKPNELDNAKSLVPEHPHYDFILMVQGEEQSLAKKMLGSIKKISSVELATFIPLDGLKSKENFIF